MTKYETKIKNSLNLPCHTNTLYEIESTEDLLKVDYNKYDELLIIGECTNLVLPTKPVSYTHLTLPTKRIV